MRVSLGRVSAVACGWLLALSSASASASASEPAVALELPASKPVPPPPPPKNGKAMYGLGIASVTLGILNIGYGIPLAIECPGDFCGAGYIGIGFGAAFIAAGAPAIHFGKRRRAVYRAWESEYGMDTREWQRQQFGAPPPKGVGLLVGGALTLAAGLSSFGPYLGAALTYDGNTGEFVPAPKLMKIAGAFGLSAMIGGATMLGFGGKLARDHRRWSRGQLTVSTPMPYLLPGGVGLGVVGQF